MYKYYETAPIAPTFADFREEAALARYIDLREWLLGRRLGLPPLMFRNADVLEFGPDTGENALVFARWGADLTLVEPAVGAHTIIRQYFEKFGPAAALKEIATADVLGYVPPRQFDVVVAEGFIHTVKPESAWLEAFARALLPGGFALESHYERSAVLVELSMKVPYAMLKRHGAGEALDIAARCYRTKWDRIPHTRAFESWVMDVLQNPFIRLATTCDAGALITAADATGFDLYASWPMMLDGLENVWGKARPSREAMLARTLAHVERSVLSFVLGTKAYIVDADDAADIRALVESAVVATDALYDADDFALQARLAATLREIVAKSRGTKVLTDGDAAYENGLAMLDAWARVHEAFAAGNDDAAVAILNGDAALLDGWGNPSHLAVWRRRADAAQ